MLLFNLKTFKYCQIIGKVHPNKMQIVKQSRAAISFWPSPAHSFLVSGPVGTHDHIIHFLFQRLLICFEMWSPVRLQGESDTVISRKTEGHSFGDHLSSESVRVTPSSVTEASTMLCSVSL
jgi:hypothetical protein